MLKILKKNSYQLLPLFNHKKKRDKLIQNKKRIKIKTFISKGNFMPKTHLNCKS